MTLTDDLDDAFAASDIILLVSQSDTYTDVATASMDYFINHRGFPGVYVTVNKPAPTVASMLENEDIDTADIFFVDAISIETNAKDGERDDTYYLSGPQNLTDLSIALSETMESMPEGDKFLFFDTLSTLTIYHEMDTISQFSHHLMGKLHGWGVKSVVMSIQEEADEQLVNHLKQFADSVVEI